MNGRGGHVLIGVGSNGKLVGQHVTDRTLQEIAKTLFHFEPHIQIAIKRVVVEDNKEVIVLSTSPRSCDIPPPWMDVLTREWARQLPLCHNLSIKDC